MSESGLRERKKLQTRRDIRVAALRLMTRHGFEAVTVDDIAQAANVSRTTFFNYFASKEAVAFDPEPGDREAARHLMDSRPAAEPLWESLEAVLVQNLGLHSDRLALQKKLKGQSPKLAASGRDVVATFYDDLRTWALERAADRGEQHGLLLVNVALALAETAFGQWEPDRPLDELVALLTSSFRLISPAAPPPTRQPPDRSRAGRT